MLLMLPVPRGNPRRNWRKTIITTRTTKSTTTLREEMWPLLRIQYYWRTPAVAGGREAASPPWVSTWWGGRWPGPTSCPGTSHSSGATRAGPAAAPLSSAATPWWWSPRLTVSSESSLPPLSCPLMSLLTAGRPSRRTWSLALVPTSWQRVDPRLWVRASWDYRWQRLWPILSTPGMYHCALSLSI